MTFSVEMTNRNDSLPKIKAGGKKCSDAGVSTLCFILIQENYTQIQHIVCQSLLDKNVTVHITMYQAFPIHVTRWHRL